MPCPHCGVQDSEPHRIQCPTVLEQAERRDRASVTCDSCGKYTGMDTGLCGQCAEDYNDRDPAAGFRRLNARRANAGLPPVRRVEARDVSD